MKLLFNSLVVIAVAGSGSVLAQDYGPRDERGRRGDETRSRDIARVTRVETISQGGDAYQRQECWDESSDRREGEYYRDESGRLYRGDGRDKTARTLIGALIGGAIGSQVGSGSGRTAATVAGAVAGGAVGRNSSDDRREDSGYDRYRDDGGREYRCRTIVEQGRHGGRQMYRVSYDYAGRSYVAMTDEHPGQTLRVDVDVRPRAGRR
jgi:uncharacterized protein YcfJ